MRGGWGEAKNFLSASVENLSVSCMPRKMCQLCRKLDSVSVGNSGHGFAFGSLAPARSRKHKKGIRHTAKLPYPFFLACPIPLIGPPRPPAQFKLIKLLHL